MRLAAWIVVLCACGGDGSDPCAGVATYCEGSVLMRCPDAAGAPVADRDCREVGDEIGQAKRCGKLRRDGDAACIDVDQSACPTVGATECAPSRTARRTCVATDFSTIWDAQPLAECMPGQRCHPTNAGELACITPPVELCLDAAPKCDGLTLEVCDGNPGDGYVVVERTPCPTRCVILGGAATCD